MFALNLKSLTVFIVVMCVSGYRVTTVDVGRGDVTVRVPSGTPPNEGWPAVLMLPGFGETAEGFEAQFGLTDAIDAYGFVQIEPVGRLDGGGYHYWMAWGSCCGGCHSKTDDEENDWYYYYYGENGGTNTLWDGRTHDEGWAVMEERCEGGDMDEDYARALVAAVQDKLPIDEDRLAVLGQSNGAYMAYRLACDAADLFSMVVASAGSPPTLSNTSSFSCEPSRPMRVLHIHGTIDDNEEYLGGGYVGGPYGPSGYVGAYGSVQAWIGYDGCGTNVFPEDGLDLNMTYSDQVIQTLDISERVEGYDTEVYTVNDCTDESSVTLWKIVGETHDPELNFAYQTNVAAWLFGGDMVLCVANEDCGLGQTCTNNNIENRLRRDLKFGKYINDDDSGTSYSYSYLVGYYQLPTTFGECV